MCSTYNPTFIDYILPSLDIFNKMCNSYDKTRLFLTTFTRILIYISIMIVLNIYTQPDTQKQSIIITKIIIFGIISFNILYLLFILFKSPENKKINSQL